MIYSANLCGIEATAEQAMKILEKMNHNNLPTLDVIRQDFKALKHTKDYINFLMQSPA